jgi:hypothetical protein
MHKSQIKELIMYQMYVLNNKRILSLTFYVKVSFRGEDNPIKSYDDNWRSGYTANLDLEDQTQNPIIVNPTLT